MISYEMDIHIPQRAPSPVRWLVRWLAHSLALALKWGREAERGVSVAGCLLVVWPSPSLIHLLAQSPVNYPERLPEFKS